MIHQDTVRLLRECDAGIKMGLSSIEDVIDRVEDKNFKDDLYGCKTEHQQMKRDIQILLDKYGDEGKEPNAVAQGMSWVKTNVKLALDCDDANVADLMTDGCNMGVKSLSKYLNLYKAADEDSKTLAKRLISSEEQLAVKIRAYL